jgi:hypothetical protein
MFSCVPCQLYRIFYLVTHLFTKFIKGKFLFHLETFFDFEKIEIDQTLENNDI